MIGFFKDSDLILPVTDTLPKRLLFPLAGGSKISSLWLGDPYTVDVTVEAGIGDTVLNLGQTEEFPDAGTAVIGAEEITYTGRTDFTLTGIPSSGGGSIMTVAPVGTAVRPKYTYDSPSNIQVFAIGNDLTGPQSEVSIRLKRLGQTEFGLPGSPALFTVMTIETGVANALQVDLQVDVVSGVEQVFGSWRLETDALSVTETGRTFSDIIVRAAGEAVQRDQGLPQRLRLLPLNREVKPTLPGFRLGEYRWRDDESRNVHSLLPTQWDLDLDLIGREKFTHGIAGDNDLKLDTLEESVDSILANIEEGTYYTGSHRHFLHADGFELEFFGSTAVGGLATTLQKKPRAQTPVFVGTWRLNQERFYETNLNYRYVGNAFDPNDSGPQFTLDRATQQLVLNQAQQDFTILVGFTSGNETDYFDLPIYPVDQVTSVYADNPQLFSNNFVFDREQGTLVVPKIATSVSGQPVFAQCEPAVAILYSSGTSVTRLLDQTDLNPAFSGTTDGFLYLQHQRQKASTVKLSVDKPRIPIPATHSSIIDLLAFGPVFFEDDFALLIAEANTSVPNEAAAGVRMQVVIEPTTGIFPGLVNYKDPNTETITVTTGGDGKATLIYTPDKNFGIWLGIPESVETGDTLLLPDPIPIGQLWNATEGWLVFTYKILDNDPLFGLVGGDPNVGEVVFTTTGTPGLSDYKTNGKRELWKLLGEPVFPIEAIDAGGFIHTHGSFDGNAVKIKFGQALPTGASIADYFISFVQRAAMSMQVENSNIVSNSIMLEMQVPDDLSDNVFLILDDTIDGVLDSFRLGITRDNRNELQIPVESTRI